MRIGEAGEDFMIGGNGADIFTFQSATQGTDWIDDFVAGQDKIDLQQSLESMTLPTFWPSRKNGVEQLG